MRALRSGGGLRTDPSLASHRKTHWRSCYVVARSRSRLVPGHLANKALRLYTRANVLRIFLIVLHKVPEGTMLIAPVYCRDP
jgi:hypothetical protein